MSTDPLPDSRTHVLLDLDGTISDSSLGIGRSLRHAFTTCGYEPPTDEQVRSVIGPPFELTFPTLGIPPEDVERVVDAYRIRYEDVGLFENEVYPGIAEMLTELADAGYVLGARHRQTTTHGDPHHRTLRLHRRLRYAGRRNRPRRSMRRTKADVITYALGQLDIEPGPHVVMVGDRDHDVEGALLNSIDCIGVTWGFGDRAELDGAGAAPVVDAPDEVVPAVAATYRPVRT